MNGKPYEGDYYTQYPNEKKPPRKLPPRPHGRNGLVLGDKSEKKPPEVKN